MKSSMNVPAEQWIKAWLDSVVDGKSTMSQRSLRRVETLGGGLDAAKKSAKKRGVHLLLLEDDKGAKIVAASLAEFQVIC